MPNARSQFIRTAFSSGQDFFLGLIPSPDYTTPMAIADFNLGHDAENYDLQSLMIHMGTYRR